MKHLEQLCRVGRMLFRCPKKLPEFMGLKAPLASLTTPKLGVSPPNSLDVGLCAQVSHNDCRQHHAHCAPATFEGV